MNTIDEYLNALDEPQKVALTHIRRLIAATVPDADEQMSYGMPACKYKGKYLIGYANFKDHMSVFPGAEPIASLEPKLQAFKRSKGTIQFTLDNPLPDNLLIEIINHSRAKIEQHP